MHRKVQVKIGALYVLALFTVKRADGIDAGGAAGRNVACRSTNGGQQNGRSDE